ncbi:MAG: hypothetical protein KIS78_06710 [Labilithrix sp.]|nr:hypothetical protein [Labilithrix sp.]
MRAAFEALAPGQTSAEPVRSSEGFYVLRKERASESASRRRTARRRRPSWRGGSARSSSRLGADADARPAIAEAVEAVLGERGVNDVDRPRAHVVDRERVAEVRLSAAAKAALETFARSARAGDRLPSPAVDGDTILVARARAPGAR